MFFFFVLHKSERLQNIESSLPSAPHHGTARNAVDVARHVLFVTPTSLAAPPPPPRRLLPFAVHDVPARLHPRNHCVQCGACVLDVCSISMYKQCSQHTAFGVLLHMMMYYAFGATTLSARCSCVQVPVPRDLCALGNGLGIACIFFSFLHMDFQPVYAE